MVIPKTRPTVKVYMKPANAITPKMDITPRHNRVTSSNSVMQLHTKAEIIDVNAHI